MLCIKMRYISKDIFKRCALNAQRVFYLFFKGSLILGVRDFCMQRKEDAFKV